MAAKCVPLSFAFKRTVRCLRSLIASSCPFLSPPWCSLQEHTLTGLFPGSDEHDRDCGVGHSCPEGHLAWELLIARPRLHCSLKVLCLYSSSRCAFSGVRPVPGLKPPWLTPYPSPLSFTGISCNMLLVHLIPLYSFFKDFFYFFKDFIYLFQRE